MLPAAHITDYALMNTFWNSIRKQRVRKASGKCLVVGNVSFSRKLRRMFHFVLKLFNRNLCTILIIIMQIYILAKKQFESCTCEFLLIQSDEIRKSYKLSSHSIETFKVTSKCFVIFIALSQQQSCQCMIVLPVLFLKPDNFVLKKSLPRYLVLNLSEKMFKLSSFLQLNSVKFKILFVIERSKQEKLN